MTKNRRKKTLNYQWSDKHIEYMSKTKTCNYNVAEGSIRAGKTTDNVYSFAYFLKRTKDKVHLATASTLPTAKLIIGDGDGFGLEHIFRGQCRWGKYLDNIALIINGEDTNYQDRIVIFAGGGKADSFKRIRGATIGMWIATEINLHHDEMIKECFRRQLRAHTKKLFWDLNPNRPTDPIYTEYIDVWQEAHDNGEFEGGYNYESFNIYDNVNVSEQNLKEFVSKYTVGTVHHKRDILGVRAIAEGLCYQDIADNPKKYLIKHADLPSMHEIMIGGDFGKNKSNTAYVASGFNSNKLYGLLSKTYPMSGKTFEYLKKTFAEFMDLYMHIYQKKPSQIWLDNAEPTYINSFRSAFPQYNIRGSQKREILQRIRATNILSASGQLLLVEEYTEPLLNALTSAVWDETQDDDVRLDDGTSDIDTLDAFEYSFESKINQLVRL